MCGRFNIVMNTGMVALVDELGVPVHLKNQYNIAPTETVPIMFEREGKRAWRSARWWLTPSWSNGPDTKYAMFNARSESLTTSRAYKEPYRHKRCVIPASSFIEWRKETGKKQPYEMMAEERALAFAGLWDIWNDELMSCSIITTKAAEPFEHIHHRMPVMLDSEGINVWLNLETATPQLEGLFASRLAHPLLVRPVDPAINSARLKVEPKPTGCGVKLDSEL